MQYEVHRFFPEELFLSSPAQLSRAGEPAGSLACMLTCHEEHTAVPCWDVGAGSRLLCVWENRDILLDKHGNKGLDLLK